jgi:hypothetical protein
VDLGEALGAFFQKLFFGERSVGAQRDRPEHLPRPIHAGPFQDTASWRLKRFVVLVLIALFISFLFLLVSQNTRLQLAFLCINSLSLSLSLSSGSASATS